MVFLEAKRTTNKVVLTSNFQEIWFVCCAQVLVDNSQHTVHVYSNVHINARQTASIVFVRLFVSSLLNYRMSIVLLCGFRLLQLLYQACFNAKSLGKVLFAFLH